MEEDGVSSYSYQISKLLLPLVAATLVVTLLPLPKDGRAPAKHPIIWLQLPLLFPLLLSDDAKRHMAQVDGIVIIYPD